MIRAYNTLDKIDEIFDDGDFNINKWEKYIKYDPFYNSNFTKKIWFLLDKD